MRKEIPTYVTGTFVNNKIVEKHLHPYEENMK